MRVLVYGERDEDKRQIQTLTQLFAIVAVLVPNYFPLVNIIHYTESCCKLLIKPRGGNSRYNTRGRKNISQTDRKKKATANWTRLP